MFYTSASIGVCYNLEKIKINISKPIKNNRKGDFFVNTWPFSSTVGSPSGCSRHRSMSSSIAELMVLLSLLFNDVSVFSLSCLRAVQKRRHTTFSFPMAWFLFTLAIQMANERQSRWTKISFIRDASSFSIPMCDEWFILEGTPCVDLLLFCSAVWWGHCCNCLWLGARRRARGRGGPARLNKKRSLQKNACRSGNYLPWASLLV